MSYCRFSDLDWKSNVYCWEGSEGFVIEVARSRIVGEVPPTPLLSQIDTDPEGWKTAHARQRAFVEAAQYERIDLPHAGERFTLADAGDCATQLEALRDLGYAVPAFAIAALREEAASDADA